jgi:hypothetical protein
MTSLAQYDRVCAAIAEATQVDDIVPLLDELELAKLKAKQIKDHKLLADATEFELRAERRLGEIIDAAKEAGLFRQGRQAKKKSSKDFLDRPTLADAGIDSKLSQRAQSRADMAPELFEDMISTTRERIAASGAKTLETSDVNGSRAIMGSREEKTDSLDYFPTPPWATRALVELVLPRFGSDITTAFPIETIWEPACGEGHMAEVLSEYSKRVAASDVKDYGYGAVENFIKYDGPGVDWIITNPPFGKKTEQFVLKAIDLANVGVAMFVRLQWLESGGRYETIFGPHPPTLIAFFAERVPLAKGRWNPKGATATAYVWLVWMKNRPPLPPFWIPPDQRKLLTKPDDAIRFTAKPVIRKEDYKSNESLTNHEHQNGTDAAIPTSAPEPASAQSLAPQPTVDAGSPLRTSSAASTFVEIRIVWSI